MDYAKAAVRAVGEEHILGLKRAVGVLDLAVMETFLMIDRSSVPREDWRGGAVGALVRQNALTSLSGPVALAGTSLEFVEKPNLGLWLVTPTGESVRIRAYPRDFKTGQPLQAKKPEMQGSLFEPDDPAMKAAFQYGLFWTLSGKESRLGQVYLAAADFTKKPQPDIYAVVQLNLIGALTDIIDVGPRFTDDLPDSEDDDYGWEQDLGEGEGDGLS